MSKPTRVLLLIDSLGPEAGTENQILEIVRRTDPGQVELLMGCMEDSGRFQALGRHVPLLLFPVRQMISPAGLGQVLHLRRQVRDLSIDVVHAVLGRSVILGVLGGYFSSAKAVVTSRRNLGYWFANKPVYLWLYRLLNHLTTRLLVNSEAARRVTANLEWVSPERIDVLYNGVDTDRFTRPRNPSIGLRLGLAPSAPVVGIVANYRPVKDLSVFLNAAQIISRQIPEAMFVLVGRGPLKEQLERQAKTLGIDGKVIFTDDLGDVAELLPWFMVGCLTSNTESFSNSILEYMAAGLPVVATNVGGIAEAVEDQRSGFVVPVGDVAAFAKAVITLLRDDRLRTDMGRYARQRCQERFSWPAVVRQHEDFYRRLVGRS